MPEMGSSTGDWTAREEEQFARYHQLLTEWNERLNLTAITAREDVYIKHFADSLTVCGMSEWTGCALPGKAVVDIGTGAGFPGLPLAIRYPDVAFTLLDSLQKRLRFLEHVIGELALKNVRLVHGRAEDVAQDKAFRNRFDAVVARAVARLNVLVELSAPFAAVGGYVFAYKGPAVDEERDDGIRAAASVGAQWVRAERIELPDGHGQRAIAVFRQVGVTPRAYPRKAGLPQKQPL